MWYYIRVPTYNLMCNAMCIDACGFGWFSKDGFLDKHILFVAVCCGAKVIFESSVRESRCRDLTLTLYMIHPLQIIGNNSWKKFHKNMPFSGYYLPKSCCDLNYWHKFPNLVDSTFSDFILLSRKRLYFFFT